MAWCPSGGVGVCESPYQACQCAITCDMGYGAYAFTPQQSRVTVYLLQFQVLYFMYIGNFTELQGPHLGLRTCEILAEILPSTGDPDGKDAWMDITVFGVLHRQAMQSGSCWGPRPCYA